MRSLKRGGSRGRGGRSKTRSGNISCAAKLGAFMLESVKGKLIFNKNTGFTNKHPQVYGVLPYLHMNISEGLFRKSMDLLGKGMMASIACVLQIVRSDSRQLLSENRGRE